MSGRDRSGTVRRQRGRRRAYRWIEVPCPRCGVAAGVACRRLDRKGETLCMVYVDAVMCRIGDVRITDEDRAYMDEVASRAANQWMLWDGMPPL